MVPVGVKAPLLKHLQVGVQLCGRPMLVVWVLASLFATARGFLGHDYSNNQAEYVALLHCLFRALRLQDPHVIFEVDCVILAKQLARHLPWACRSENLTALHQQCVHVCDSLSALHISWDIHHIYREFNQTADTLFNQAFDERVAIGFSAFW